MILSLVVVLSMSMTKESPTFSAEHRPEKRTLYIYSNKELSKFFKKIGHQDLWYNDIRISRNSDGTALRFLNESKKKILIVTCDGSIKVIDSPGYLAWLNDTNHVIVWFDDKSIVHYANVFSERRSFSPYSGPDPSGKYFTKDSPDLPAIPLSESCYTSIYATEQPNLLLAKVNICGATRIFYKDKKVFLTGKQYHNGSRQEEEIRVFIEKGNTLEQVDRIIVSDQNESLKHFYAVDLCPWDDEMLFIDASDFPARSIWYTFNLRSHQFKKVSKVSWSGGCAFYLKYDIIKEAIQKKKRK